MSLRTCEYLFSWTQDISNSKSFFDSSFQREECSVAHSCYCSWVSRFSCLWLMFFSCVLWTHSGQYILLWWCWISFYKVSWVTQPSFYAALPSVSALGGDFYCSSYQVAERKQDFLPHLHYKWRRLIVLITQQGSPQWVSTTIMPANERLSPAHSFLKMINPVSLDAYLK